MLKKTRHFDDKFQTDIKSIAVYNHRIIGSYVIKEDGDYITDIDVNQFVYYNPGLFPIITRQITNSKYHNFLFLYVNCGYEKHVEVPWSIDERGSCSFSLLKSIQWAKNLQEKIYGEKITKYINNVLNGPKLYIANLIRIEEMLKEKFNLKWSLDDIKTRYKIVNGEKYDFIEMAKKKNPVIKYVYNYNNNFCQVDVGLVDKKYSYYRYSLYQYYVQDWYKIFKLYRWKVKESFRPEYKKISNKIENISVLRARLEILQRITKTIGKRFPNLELHWNNFKSLLKRNNLTYSQTLDKELKKNLDRALYKQFKLLYNNLPKKILHQMTFDLYRGMQAQIPRKREELLESTEECPFFAISVDNFHKIVSLGLKINYNITKLTECLLSVSEKFKMPLEDVINEMSINNNTYLEIEADTVKVYQKKELKYSENLSELKRLQLFTLFSQPLSNDQTDL